MIDPMDTTQSMDHTQDDSGINIDSPESGTNSPPPFRRINSEQTFNYLQKMEKKYSKLGDKGYKQKDFNANANGNAKNGNANVNGRIKVASLNSIHKVGKLDLNPEPVFAGRRDITDPSSIKERQIVSRKGSVRGFKNRVKAGIATFLEQKNGVSELGEDGFYFIKRNYREEEKGKIVIYTSSMTVVRETADRCKAVKNALQTHMVRYEERDMFMSAENQRELRERLGQDGDGDGAIDLPQVFADGVYIGGGKEVLEMNETGELRTLLNSFSKIQLVSYCDKCGGYRFLPCTFCHGSKKSLHRNEFTEEFCALRCMQCDENGLIRCDACVDQQE